MPIEYLDGALFRSALKETLRKLELKRKNLNQINVFPVPDGDTGNNMLATMESAYQQVSCQSETHLGLCAKAAYLGAREGSTGNSGAIFTQFLKGLAAVFMPLEKAGAIDLSDALKAGVVAAYAAIRDPREGTILTVARKAFEATESVATDNTMASTLLIMYLEARKALANTARILPALKEKKVIDAGGWGLLIFFSALLEVMGVPTGKPEYHFQSTTTFYESRESFAYENPFDLEFVIPAFADMDHKVAALIETDGTELIIQPNELDCHVHIHTNDPEKVVEKIMTLAPIREIVLRDMIAQAIDHANRDDGGPCYKTVVIGRHPGFLAMAIMAGAEVALSESCVMKLSHLLEADDPTDVLVISSVNPPDYPLRFPMVLVKDDVTLLASLVTVFSTEKPSDEVILRAANYPRIFRIASFDWLDGPNKPIIEQLMIKKIQEALEELKPVMGEVLTLFFGANQSRAQMKRLIGAIEQEYPELAEVELRFGSQPEALILAIQ